MMMMMMVVVVLPRSLRQVDWMMIEHFPLILTRSRAAPVFSWLVARYA
jgi:hypothetical protein